MTGEPQGPVNYIVALPPPTPNGSLHVGHIAGPFLAADIFLKAQRRAGNTAVSVSYSDVNQSYVAASAARLGTSPEDLSRRASADIVAALLSYGCAVDRFAMPDASTNASVRGLVLGLFENGGLEERPFPFFHSARLGRFLGEAEVSGRCPTCLDACKCGICEGCAVINSAATLLSPVATTAGADDLKRRDATVLVLDLEAHRDAITGYFAARQPFRPRYRWVAEDALAARLPVFPVTVPGDWGIALGDRFPGQVVNPWAEVLGQFLHQFREVRRHLPADRETRIVNFFGFDNSYFYAIVHIAMLDAMGDMASAPFAVMINEFYDLDHRKFSTSQGHVLWASDLARRHDPDLIRFYLALEGPGFERANFNEAAMLATIEDRVGGRWRELAQRYDALRAQGHDPLPPCQPDIEAAAQACRRRIAASFDLDRFHLRQGAVDLVNLLDFASRHAARSDVGAPQRLADLIRLRLHFAHALYPVCPGAAQRLMGGMPGPAPMPPDLFLRGSGDGPPASDG